ncbi:MAG: condensation domain-containing protein, partial [Methylococcales bacterium]
MTPGKAETRAPCEEASLVALLAELERLDIKLWVDQDRLRFDAPQGALNADMRTRLQDNKSAMIEFLSRGKGTSLQKDDPQGRETNLLSSFPPTFAQRHFGQLQKLHPGQYFYNVPFAYRLRGKFEVGLLRESLQAMLRRHDFLRTTLRDDSNGGLMQVVTPFDEEKSTIPVPVVALQHLPESQRSDQALRVMQTEWRRPFDLARDWPLRVCLLQLAEEEHILLLCLHNVGFEAGSLTALLHELGAQYAALSAGESCALAPLPMQYAD